MQCTDNKQVTPLPTLKNVNFLATKKRESNLELLRLISMFYILTYHFCTHSDIVSCGGSVAWAAAVVLHIGVICFVLISGYFGIKTRVRGIVNLFCLVSFYGLIMCLLGSFLNDDFNIKTFIRGILPFSRGYYWFIICYAQLYLIAPFVNKAIERMTRKQLLMTLLLFAYFSIYMGLIMSNGVYAGGKNIINFVFIYLIGRYIRLYMPIRETERQKYLIKSLALYFSLAAVVFVLIGFAPNIIYKITSKLSFPYNSPLLIIMAVLFFNIFRSVKINSKIINYLATSALSIYLIHENPCTSKYVYAPVSIWYENQSVAMLIVYMLAYALVIFFACIFIDKIRLYAVRLLKLETISIKIDEKATLLYNKLKI